MQFNTQDDSLSKPAESKGSSGSSSNFLSKSMRALHVSSPSKHKASTGSASTSMHKRQPTEDSLAVQISVDDEQEISADEQRLLLAGQQPLFAPRHRRMITPMGGGNKEDEDGDTTTSSSGYLSSSMNALPSNATMATCSSSGSLADQIKTCGSISQGNNDGGKKKSKSKKEKTKFTLLNTKPLPRLGNDSAKHSTRNISTEVLADEQDSQTEYDTQAERRAYYDSLQLSRNDFVYASSSSTTSNSFFGGVLGWDGGGAGNNAEEFRLPTEENKIYHASIFRSSGTRRSSDEGVHRSDFDIQLSGQHYMYGKVDDDDGSSSIRHSGSFDTMVSRDRSFYLGPLKTKQSHGAVAFVTRRSTKSILSEEDNASVSNMTYRSGVTTASVETMRHSNRAMRGNRQNIIRSRKVADRVTIDERDSQSSGADSDRDYDSDNDYGAKSPSKKSIPKVLRKTGTKLKRALREVAGSNTKSSRPSPKKGVSEHTFGVTNDGIVDTRPRRRLGSEPGIQLTLDDAVCNGRDFYHGPCRARIHSADMKPNTAYPSSTSTFHEIDAAIIGRLDGVDILDLGPARYQTTGGESERGPIYTPRRMVLDLLTSSGGKAGPEIIFEGPSGEASDRWIASVGKALVIDENSTNKRNDCGDDSAESAAECHELLPCFGASRVDTVDKQNSSETPTYLPAEGHHPPLRDGGIRFEEHLPFASSSCPVDVDEDIFIIENSRHLDAVHETVASAIRRGMLGQALRTFAKLIRSLKYRAREHDDAMIELLLASTHTNMAIVCLWMERAGEALHHINSATKIRTEYFPKSHPAVAVSFAKRGLVEFCINDIDASLHSYRCAIDILTSHPPQHQAMLAKLENNIGCSLFQQSKSEEALKHFTISLEMQRPWVEGDVRREAAVFNCGVTLTNLGKAYLALKDYSLAPYAYEEALLLQTSTFAKSHRSVLRTLESLAYVKSVVGDGKEALRIYRAVYRSLVATHGENSQSVMDIVSLIGALSVEQQSYGEALKCFHSLLEWQKEKLPSDHPTIVRTSQTVARIEAMLDRSTV